MRNFYWSSLFSDESVKESCDRSGGFAVLQFILMLVIMSTIFALSSIVGFYAQKGKLTKAGTYFASVLEKYDITLSVSDRELLINGEASTQFEM